MKKSKRKQPPPKVLSESKGLKGLSFHINALGEIVRDVKTEEINAFLDKNVPDKKFLDEDETKV